MRLTYANVMATVAVCIALVGGGQAAIGSTVTAARSLASRVAKAVKVANSASKRSKKAQKTASTALTRANDTYTKSQSDARFIALNWPALLRYGATVPSEQTLSGVYGAGSPTTPPDSDGVLSTIADTSFPVPFASGLTAVYVKTGDTPPANCPGTLANPAAKPGFVCLFEGHADTAATRDVLNPITQVDNTASRFGFQVAISRNSASVGYAEVDGTWAATAP